MGWSCKLHNLKETQRGLRNKPKVLLLSLMSKPKELWLSLMSKPKELQQHLMSRRGEKQNMVTIHCSCYKQEVKSMPKVREPILSKPKASCKRLSKTMEQSRRQERLVHSL